MAFTSTGLKLMAPGGLSNAEGSLWRYLSSDGSTAVGAITGYFAGQGYGGRTASAGMRVGDVVLVQETTAGNKPGRVTLHSVISSTNDQTDIGASTGFNYAKDITISSASTA